MSHVYFNPNLPYLINDGPFPREREKAYEEDKVVLKMWSGNSVHLQRPCLEMVKPATKITIHGRLMLEIFYSISPEPFSC